jgi:ATP-dependent HslUV protease ATP-binding subunit HslU
VNTAVENKILDLLTGESPDATTRDTFRNLYREGALNERMVEVDVPSNSGRITLDPSGGMQSVQVPRPATLQLRR